MHSDKYLTHLRSPEWSRFRRDIIRSVGCECERCQAHGVPLEVHHRHYETLGCETGADVQVLCVPCHEDADLERRDEVRNAHWWCRVEGWAQKVYGSSWLASPGFEEAQTAFESWLERKGFD